MVLALLLSVSGCSQGQLGEGKSVAADRLDDAGTPSRVAPQLVTQKVLVDSDDPAIWLHPEDPSKSLVLGTDKGGAVHVFDLDGKIVKSVTGMQRMNNVDVEYGMMLGGEAVDIAVATDRDANLVRAFRLPEMESIDGGGFPIFDGEEPEQRRPMGVALYKRPSDGMIFAIFSRKEGPSGSYLWQYRLDDDGSGNVSFSKVREFGAFSGSGEIEAVAVDDELGYLYYSDETAGIHKYHADPDVADADVELALFGTDGFADDREGISIYRINDGTGYILVSDQQANRFRVFPREGAPGAPHEHRLIKVVHLSTEESDGSEVTPARLNDQFPVGLFMAMSDDMTFQFYSWADIAGDDLVVAPDGARAHP